MAPLLYALLTPLLLSACPSTSDTGTVEAEYTLNLVPVIAANQDPFDGLDRLDLVVEYTDGDTDMLRFNEASGTLEYEGLGPLDDVTIAVEGYADGALMAFGRSETLSITEGELTVEILVSEVDNFAWLEALDEGAHGAAVAPSGDGAFYVFGGSDRFPSLTSGSSLDSITRLSVAPPGDELSFDYVDDMPAYSVNGTSYTGRSGHTATLLTGEGAGEGMILVAGGADGYVQVPSVTEHAFLFVPDSEEIAYELEMVYGRWGHKAVQNRNGDVLILGGVGYNANAGTVDTPTSIESFSRSSGTFEATGAYLPSGGAIYLYNDAAPIEEDGVLYCGGFELSNVDEDEDQEWRARDDCITVSLSGVVEDAEPMPARLVHFSLTPLSDGRVLLTGGQETPDWTDQSGSSFVAPVFDEIWIYDPDSDSWSDTGKQLRIPRHHHATAPLPDGRVLIAGGSAEEGSLLGTTYVDGLACAEIYDPSNNTLVLVDDCEVEDEVSTLPQRMNDPSIAWDPRYGVVVLGGLDGGYILDAAALWIGGPEQ
jgi:hypothetical protein